MTDANQNVEPQAPVDTTLADMTLADPGVHRCPFGYYATMQDESPVHYDRHTDLWMITRYDDVVSAAGAWERFSSHIDMRRDVSNVDPTEADELFKREGYFVEDVLSQVDPPRHTPFRRLVEKLFTGPTVKRMHDYLDTHVVELIDAFADRGRADFYHEFAVPLPVDVIADQLGLPRSDGMKLKRWTDAFIASFDATITAERKLECVKGILEFQKYFVAKRDEKLAQPGDDLLSMLVAARKDDGTPLTIEEYLALCAQLMVAGNETTRNVLLAGLHKLVTDPALQTRLRRSPDLIPRFVDEMLRLEAPAQGLFRRCTREVTLGGVTLPEGAKVLLLFGAGNRDPRAFPNPDEVVLDRPNGNRHLAFGYGIHSCIGRTLATAELTIAFTRLLERLDDIRLAPDAPTPQIIPHFNMRGLDSLSIVFRKRGEADDQH